MASEAGLISIFEAGGFSADTLRDLATAIIEVSNPRFPVALSVLELVAVALDNHWEGPVSSEKADEIQRLLEPPLTALLKSLESGGFASIERNTAALAEAFFRWRGGMR